MLFQFKNDGLNLGGNMTYNQGLFGISSKTSDSASSVNVNGEFFALKMNSEYKHSVGYQTLGMFEEKIISFLKEVLFIGGEFSDDL